MKLKWQKLGHVFNHSTKSEWIEDSALTPTPILLDEDRIRVYCGFRDRQGVSRIGYVDVSAKDPSIILKVSDKPSLDIGSDGAFDDNGVILGDVIRVENGILRMYYVGFQLVKKAKFLAFSGVAESADNGETFQRKSNVPILDRSDEGLTINAIHSVIKEKNKWRIWYAAGNDWQEIAGVSYPKYNIRYTESFDGLTIDLTSVNELCVDVEGDEYRIGRPSVFKINKVYIMFYTKGGITGKDYFPGVAYSEDGVNWKRNDECFGLTMSEDGFDSIHLCYPRLITVGSRVFCFYNGNYMGKEGFGVAELLDA
ncbi:hypothetical protein [Enterovibrio norvegicus]|uniref:hypothetical protein n=1 Tax=Enterovibrio norvegicus TaxID=188144 RepID=UPI00352BE327